MPRLETSDELKLLELARAIVDQRRARVIVPPQQDAPGFWFGGGNLTRDPQGRLILVGRYRNYGDSRTGLGAGERGLELAIFRSADEGQSFQEVVSFSKSELNVADRKVLSIEGSALHWRGDGVELFVSTEKSNIGYPTGLESYLKPNTGVWTIDRLHADSIESLKSATPATILPSKDPGYLHVKDPSVYAAPNGDLTVIYCTHPFCWSSSNSACAIRSSGASDFGPPNLTFFPRGPAWDVAITRATALVDVPSFAGPAEHRISLLFYDGGESLRNLDEHSSAVQRPRGYSCEELGGVAYILDGDLTRVYRLSRDFPSFVSPFGTGCSRYVDVLRTDNGYLATWQQSQADESQPLVMNFLDHDLVVRILGLGRGG